MATFERIPEIIIPGHRLGRHIHRPENFGVAPVKTAPIKNKTWHRHCPPFTQGNLGSCVGNASAGSLMTDPLWIPGRQYTEANAVTFYSDATRFNGQPTDYYPPNDTGSSGPAAAQALEKLGLIHSSTDSTDLNEALGGLMVSNGIFGVNWMTSFDTPLPSGECPLTTTATVRGGHEIQAFEVDATNERVWFYQSWGVTWGGVGNGTFWLAYATLEKLFATGADATFFTAPVPAPAPS